MRAIAYIAFPLVLAYTLYAGAIQPAMQAVDKVSASIQAAQNGAR